MEDLEGNAADAFKLPEDMKQNMLKQEGEIKNARKAIESLKKMGINTQDLEDKLTWADEARKTLLKDFG